MEALADMREATQRRKLRPATDVDEIIDNCFKQVGVLCLNDLDVTDAKARNWIYQSVQNKEVNVLIINLTVYRTIMEMWMRSQGSTKQQINNRNANEIKQIIK